MRYIRQLLIILAVSFLGEVLRRLIPLPIPAGIYGMVLMLLALKWGIIKLEQVREVSEFLLSIMVIMFIPPAVGLMASYTDLKAMLFPALIISVFSTVLVMAVTGRITQYYMKWQRRREK